MGLLDDLKQQADSLRQKQQVTQAELNQNLLLAHAKLKDGLHYLVDLFNSLNVIKPVVARYYSLEGGVTQLENLLQCDYNCNGRRLTVDHRDFIEAIVLRFRCVADGQITIEKQSGPDGAAPARPPVDATRSNSKSTKCATTAATSSAASSR